MFIDKHNTFLNVTIEQNNLAMLEKALIPATLGTDNSTKEEAMQIQTTEHIVLLTKKSYFEMIERSIGSPLFRNLYACVGDTEKDILENGNVSCAYYVSCILLIFKLIRAPHAMVEGTLRDMLSYGWYKSDAIQKGCVISWEDKYFIESGKTRGHIGFYVGNGIAVSNNPVTGTPQKHLYKVYMGRPLKDVYSHPLLKD